MRIPYLRIKERIDRDQSSKFKVSYKGGQIVLKLSHDIFAKEGTEAESRLIDFLWIQFNFFVERGMMDEQKD